MSERPCPRCLTLLNDENSGALVFCWHCGAPQIVLSEELRSQALEQSESRSVEQIDETGLSGSPTATVATLGDPTAVDWPAAIRTAGLAGAISMALILFSVPVPRTGILLFLFWALGAPIVTLGIYSSRHKQTAIRTGFGASLGLIGGLAIVAGATSINVIELLLLRFGLHRGSEIDNLLSTSFAKIRDAQPDPSALPFLNYLTVPEFRIGLLFFYFAVGAAMYLAYSTVGGAFGGFLRSRSRNR